MTEASQAAVSCALCGVRADPLPLTWMTEFDSAHVPVHYCGRCARENVRAIESKLRQEWW